MVRRLLPTLIVLTGCTASDELTLGVAMWPFVLSTDTRYAELGHLRGGVVVVAAVEVERQWSFAEIPLTGADVSASVDGTEVDLAEGEAGLYLSAPEHVPALYAPADSPSSATLTAAGARYEAAAPTGIPLEVPVPLAPHTAGRSLTLALPEGYDDDYDQLLVEVRDIDGAVTWSNVPETLHEWLEFASSRWTPEEVRVPADAFPDRGALYGVSLFGVIRTRPDAEFSGNLNGKLSGYTTGSALAVPVWTAP